MKKTRYCFAHPESELGLTFARLKQGSDGDGHPDWKLVAVTPIGLYVLRRKNWLEKLLNLA